MLKGGDESQLHGLTLLVACLGVLPALDEAAVGVGAQPSDVGARHLVEYRALAGRAEIGGPGSPSPGGGPGGARTGGPPAPPHAGTTPGPPTRPPPPPP